MRGRLETFLSETTQRGIYISLESALWLVLIASAAAVRLIFLDAAPLTLAEAENALAIWRTAQGVPPPNWTGDFTSALTVFVMRLTDGGVALLRLMPALWGMLLVPALWWLRPVMGAGAALIAAALLAFSPVAVFTARSAVTDSAGIVMSALIVAAAFGYVRRQLPERLTLLALIVGIAFSADAIAVTTVLALAVFVAYQWSWNRDGEVAYAVRAALADRGALVVAAVAGLSAFGIAVTRLGTDVRRLSTPALDQWADLFTASAQGVPGRYFLDVFLGYELLLLVVGGTAAIALLWRWLRGGWSALGLWQQFLLVWLALALVTAALAEERTPGAFLILTLPLSLAAGTWLAPRLRRMQWQGLLAIWPFVAASIALGVFVLMRVGRWSLDGRVGNTGDVMLVIAAAWAGVLLLWLGLMRQGGSTGIAVLTLLALFLVPVQVHNLTALSYRSGSEYLVSGRLTPQAAHLSQRLATVANGVVAIDPSLANAIGWYLRDHERVVVARTPPQQAEVLVWPTAGETQSDYRVLEAWRVGERWYPPSVDLLRGWRWFVYRQPFGPVSQIEAVLMVKEGPTQ